ncbi:MAG TPA: alpha-2-macroglobulin family protein, partial [bacterium]|nr:alpha-2-macroglobulin family protein [bacterium]
NSDVSLSRLGGFYLKFEAEDSPAGVYDVQVVWDNRVMCETSFRMEDYRIPRFEVRLHGDDTVPLDRPFDVEMTASYYAGGNMVDRPVDWQVTRHSVEWDSERYPGFLFADDDRFTGRPEIAADTVLEKAAVTDATGASRITIDPLRETSLSPRRYIVEATVTDVDEQTVTGVKEIRAYPAFIVGLKAPRLLAPGRPLQVETIVLNPDNQPEAGRDVTIRLIRRTWHAVLKAGNYGAGDIRYDTHAEETLLDTRMIPSSDAPVPVRFQAAEAGVYIVEASTRDRLGRAQVVRTDVFVKGDTPVTWDRPSDSGFTVQFDRKEYVPGDTAKLVLESPFQTAEAAAVVESPDAVKIYYAPVRNGSGTIEIPVGDTWSPGLPVSVLLMRGRLPDSKLDPVTGIDLGKPQTLGAMTRLSVSRDPYRVTVDASHPEKALPGETITLTLKLTDGDHRPVSGEAAVWLVDRAVLALGRETSTDPLLDLLPEWPSRAALRDTREYVVGRLPGVDTPGGGIGGVFGAALSMFDRLSLRKRFQAVPFFEPFVTIGDDGSAVLKVSLPDNLTQYAVRVKATTDADHFGFYRSRLAVRLPLVIQPTLPRFLRPNDGFDAIAVSRIVEGEPGDGRVAIQADALDLRNDAVREVRWEMDVPVRSEFRLNVPDMEVDDSGHAVLDTVRIRMAAERVAGGPGDAVENELPVRDEFRVRREILADMLTNGQTLRIPGSDNERMRPGSCRRQVWISNQPILVTALRAESMLQNYPWTCTEQRTSIASGFLAMMSMQEFLATDRSGSRYSETIQSTIDYTGTVMNSDGLISFWPGGKGHVHLTARVMRFLADARRAGYDVDPLIVDRMSRALKQALRSDSDSVLPELAIHERVLALEALYAMGYGEESYLEEIGRSVETLGTPDRARVVRLLASLEGITADRLNRLIDGLLADVIFETFNGRRIATGLRSDPGLWWIQEIFASDLTAVGEILLTLIEIQPEHPAIPELADGMSRMFETRTPTTYHAASLLSALNALIRSGTMRQTPSDFSVNDTRYRNDTSSPVHIIMDDGVTPLNVTGIEGEPVVVQSEISGIIAGPAAEYSPF